MQYYLIYLSFLFFIRDELKFFSVGLFEFKLMILVKMYTVNSGMSFIN